MKIAIGNDHAGTQYKNKLILLLESLGHTITNHGTDSDESMDYPDTIHPVAKQVENKQVDLGIIICGSGNGANMTANKHTGVRSALCWSEEIASLARKHNNANILSIPARFISLEDAKKITLTFINTNFEGGRHQKRIDKIPNCS
jgi:ribose 5-phosphate isomerase B